MVKLSKLMSVVEGNIKNRDYKKHLYLTTMLEIDKVTKEFRIKMKNKIIK